MVSVGGFSWSQYSTVQAATSAATTAASAAAAKTDTSSSPGMRDAYAASTIKLDLSSGTRTEDGVRTALRKKVDEAMGSLYKNEDRRRQVTDEAMKSLEPQITEAAKSKDVKQIQMRLASVESKSAIGDAFGSATSIRMPGMEVGLVRNGKVSAADTSVLDLSGKTLNLSTAEKSRGIASGSYSTYDAGGGLTGKAGEDYQKAQASIARIRATQDALSAYRQGNTGPLTSLSVLEQNQSGTASYARQTALYQMTANGFKK